MFVECSKSTKVYCTQCVIHILDSRIREVVKNVGDITFLPTGHLGPSVSDITFLLTGHLGPSVSDVKFLLTGGVLISEKATPKVYLPDDPPRPGPAFSFVKSFGKICIDYSNLWSKISLKRIL